MGRRTFRWGQAAAVCLIAAVLQVGAPQPAVAQLDAKRAEADALQRRIAEQGRELSIADEAFNRARIERQQVDAKASAARGLVEAADARWAALKAQLARRVRLLYMHPGAALDAYLSQRSFSDLERAHKFGSSVLTADAELVTATEKARQEVLARARSLDELRDQARGKERELANRRVSVSSAVGEQRELLGKVNGEIADLMEAERKAELAAARQQASRIASQGAPEVDDDDDAEEERSIADDEPTGPPPSVKAGAATAVATAREQLGKPYEWAAAGPDSFDCSGLTMYAWAKGGVSLPHSSGAQYSSLPHVARSQLQPGDLVFYGSPIHHVGIYEGGGVMINAPETGENVRRDSIARSDYVGAARP
jgi:cell wall-associated NlpC family hydrolase